MNTTDLFTPLKSAAFDFPNRIVMGPMTRCRADITSQVPNDLHVKYYSERAKNSAFVMTECTAVSLIGNCFAGACGIYTDEQVEGWKKVTDAVHNENGKIFLQIWHCGRQGHSDIYGPTIAPSAIKIEGKQVHTLKGKKDNEVPREMTLDDIKSVIGEFRKGAENALKAGFDGVELHGANGYLVDEFLRDKTNKRTDDYGGSVENRSRFLLEVVDELIAVFGKDRVGVRVSPLGRYGDMYDSDPLALYTYAVSELSKRGIFYLEIFESDMKIYGIPLDDQTSNWKDPLYKSFRPLFNGIYIANGGFTKDSANEMLAAGDVDMVSFARDYIANPDLVLRLKNNWPLNPVPDMSTWYNPMLGEKFYTDFDEYKP